MDKNIRRIVHGTPITPVRLLEPLRGGSFCVSFAAPEQLNEAIDLVGSDGILVLDNGAFSVFTATEREKKLAAKEGRAPRYIKPFDRYEFWAWANAAQARCPVAVAVIPDAIGGDETANLIELSYALRGEHALAKFPDRTMSIWHLNDSDDFLVRQLRLMNFVGIGSCLEYDVQRHRKAYHARLKHVYRTRADVKDEHGRCPWIHLMRGLGEFEDAAWAESADSTNVARNHYRLKRKGLGDERAGVMAARIEAPIQAAANRLPIDRTPVSNFA